MEALRQDPLFQAALIQQPEESIDRFRLNLDMMKENQANLTVRTPITGLLSSFIVKVGETAVRRAIRLGRQNSQYFEVLEGLEEGETVITSMYDDFGDMEQLVLK